MASQYDNGDLRNRLSEVLPKDYDFVFHHISTPPTKTDPLYSPPPTERPERTYCENHFLAVSINVPEDASGADGATLEKQVMVLGVEVFIYTTAKSTTLFVSKADSTGYLNLLKLPRGTSSPIREICATFIGFLVEKRKRRGIQFIINLFARAQAQYLFPGSVDYSGKHVLDDRGLIRWWCRVLDPLLGPAPEASWKSSKAYLVVPGLEPNETRALTPRNAGSTPWELSHPLERISHYYREVDWVPPRCLIPHFPDDPKSRFRDELDEEAASSAEMKKTGNWKSVKTLDMFWEMMAYRQECSSGRMTGFVWLVFDDEADEPAKALASTQTAEPATLEKQCSAQITPSTTPCKLSSKTNVLSTKRPNKKKPKKLRGVVVARQPHIKTRQRDYHVEIPTSTADYSWEPQGRGEKVTSETDYKRSLELLLHLDFATLSKAQASTRRWVNEVGMGGKWGFVVKGMRETPAVTGNGDKAVNNLTGLVKRKRTDSQSTEGQGGKVNVLSAGLVKRKARDGEKGEEGINVLSAGLVRRKPRE